MATKREQRWFESRGFSGSGNILTLTEQKC